MLKPPSGNPPICDCRTRVNGNFNPGDGLALSRINQEMRIHVFEFVRFLKDYVPGFENAWLIMQAPWTHARGGKSIDAEYVVYTDDVRNSARFHDVVTIHYDDKAYYPGGCDIPYRMFLPKGVEGLLAAGRSIIKRGPQIRQRPVPQLMGEVAGIAAALAVKKGVEPRHIDIRQLQKILVEQGSDLGPQEHLRELGLR